MVEKLSHKALPGIQAPDQKKLIVPRLELELETFHLQMPPATPSVVLKPLLGEAAVKTSAAAEKWVAGMLAQSSTRDVSVDMAALRRLLVKGPVLPGAGGPPKGPADLHPSAFGHHAQGQGASKVELEGKAVTWPDGMRDQYFDDKAQSLAAAGVTLRLRDREGQRASFNLKPGVVVSEGITQRVEYGIDVKPRQKYLEAAYRLGILPRPAASKDEG